MGEVRDVSGASSIDYASLLSERFSEVSPRDFYRELFPEGSLQASRPGKKGEYPAIAVQIRESGNLRHTVLDDLSVVEELCATDDFCVMSPVTYAGQTQRKSMAHALHAVVIDLDGLKVCNGEPRGFKALLAMVGREGGLPQPSFIVASGTGLHLYFMLDEPYLRGGVSPQGFSAENRKAPSPALSVCVGFASAQLTAARISAAFSSDASRIRADFLTPAAFAARAIMSAPDSGHLNDSDDVASFDSFGLPGLMGPSNA